MVVITAVVTVLRKAENTDTVFFPFTLDLF